MTDNDWFFDLFGDEPKKMTSAQCPKCGKFCKVIRSGNDGAPLSAEDGIYVVVDCPVHGKGYS